MSDYGSSFPDACFWCKLSDTAKQMGLDLATRPWSFTTRFRIRICPHGPRRKPTGRLDT
jgi:hypothetical protein